MYEERRLPACKGFANEAVATGLKLRELEAVTRPRLPGFLAFFHARVASQQVIGFECGAQIYIDLHDRARNRETRPTGVATGRVTAGITLVIAGVLLLQLLPRL